MTHTRVFGYQSLGLVLIHVFFGFLIWDSVTNFTGQILTLHALTSGAELMLVNLTDKVFLELLIAPVAAILFCCFMPSAKQQTKAEETSVNILTILMLTMTLAVLLPLNMSLQGTEGLILSVVLGFSSGVLFRPIPAVLLGLSLSASTFMFIALVHGSFFAVLLGLIYQNTLLFGVGVGIIARFFTKRIFVRS